MKLGIAGTVVLLSFVLSGPGGAVTSALVLFLIGAIKE